MKRTSWHLAALIERVLVIVLGVSAVPAVWSQTAAPPTGQIQLYGTVDVSKLPQPTGFGSKFKHYHLHEDMAVFERAKAKANSRALVGSGPAPGPGPASAISIGPGAGFLGMSLADSSLGAVPPDTQVAAGAGFIMEAVNIDIRIWNQNVNPPAVTSVDLISLFGLFFSDVVSDPRIRFDPAQQRWYISCVSVEQTFFNQGTFRLAVSTSADPTQGFTLYAASTPGAFPDYPHLGFNDDKLVLTGNSYSLPLSQTSPFIGTEFMVINKSDLMNPAVTNPHTTFFAAPQGLDSIQPSVALSSTCGSPGCPLFMAAIPDASLFTADTIRIWSLQGVPGVGSGVTASTTDLSIPALTIPPNAVQQGSANLINTDDARLLDAEWRNDSLWVSSHTGCTPPGDDPAATRSCLHFSQINTATMSLFQNFVFGEAGIYDYYPAIQTDFNDNLIAVFNRSSSAEYPSVYVGSQAAGASAGTFQTPFSVFEGQYPLTASQPSFNRWGDYSGAHIDPSGATVWVAGEIAHSAANDDWGTAIVQVYFNGGGLISTATTVVSSGSPSTYGQPVTFTATVAPSSGTATPTGTVTFKDGLATLGTGTLNSSGQATLTTASLAAGPHTIAAVYGGDGSFSGSASTSIPQTVNLVGSSASVTSSLNPSTRWTAVTFTATVTPNSGTGTPTGAVTFKDGSATLGTGTLDSSGNATLTTSNLTVGSHSITAVYGGDPNFAGSTSPVLTQTVNQVGSAASVTSSLNPSTKGITVTFTAAVTPTSGTATPTGSVTFQDGGVTLGTKTLSSGHATLATSTLAVGPHSITAVYGGDTNFITSTSPLLTQTVNQAGTTTSLTSSRNPSTTGIAVTFTATVTPVSGTAPTGTVTFKDGGTTLGTGALNSSNHATLTTSTLAVGSHSITAVYGGDANFTTSTSPALTQTVNRAGTSTSVTSSRNPSTTGIAVTFTATVTPVSGSGPTGTVTFKDGSTTLGTGALDSSRHATLTTSSLAVGSHSITAVYAGDTSFLGSTSPALTQTVNRAGTTTSVTSSLNPSTNGTAVTFTATVTPVSGTGPTGTVTFKDGSTTLGTGTLDSSSHATLTTSSLAAGSHSITAVYGGDTSFTGSTSPVLTQTVH